MRETSALAAPQDIQSTGIRKQLLEDLALKILYLHGEMSLIELGERMCLSLGVIEEIFHTIRKEQLCEVKGMTAGSHRIVASMAGKLRAGELLSQSQYSGPAPVSLADYATWVKTQSVQGPSVAPTDLRRAFQQLILTEELLGQLGTAVVSGTSIFLYGPPGTGKTTIANYIPDIYNDAVWVPYALEVDSQIISIFDPGVHKLVDPPVGEEFDKRWARCKRPRVFAGGELTAEMLDLQFNANSKYFTAPLQLKANNGVLVLDDFGRQRIRPEELLNRWMTPLDRRMDFLTLPGGRKFEVPFDLFVVFSTNLEPKQLADEAFLRRIANKIKINHASPTQFLEIFQLECWSRFLPYDEGLPEHVSRYITETLGRPLAHCYARDLINQIFWAASYEGVAPRLTRETLEQACRNYFLSTDKN